ncbi:MAG: hypothetical protein MZV64_43325 [Ignavibacteriales bacterium]|nr:hypothetical protein [Ignavibacteriales bacterium]
MVDGLRAPDHARRSPTLPSGTCSPPGAVSRRLADAPPGRPARSSGKRTTTSKRRGPSRTSVAVAPPTAVSTSSRTSRDVDAVARHPGPVDDDLAPARRPRAPRPAGRPRRGTSLEHRPDLARPAARATAASGPKTFTATSAFTPETTSSRRMAIGWVKLNSTPGSSRERRRPSRSISSSFVRPLFHSSMGWRMT